MAFGEKTMQLNEIKDLKNGIWRCMIHDCVWTFVCLRFLNKRVPFIWVHFYLLLLLVSFLFTISTMKQERKPSLYSEMFQKVDLY